MKKLLYKKRATTGFTLIELLVVATIIIVLTTIGVVSYRNASIRSRDSKRKADLETVRQALVLYRSEAGIYPSDNGYFAGMVSELQNEGYLSGGSELFQDPSGGVYIYNCISGCAGFTLSATLEGSETPYELRNP